MKWLLGVILQRSQDNGSPSSDNDPCNNLKENLTWLYGAKDNGKDAISFLLNPSSKELSVSNPIVKLSEGEIYYLRFRVVGVKKGGTDGCFVEINKGGRENGSGWVFVLKMGMIGFKKVS